MGIPEDQTFHCKDGVADVEAVEAAMAFEVSDLHLMELAVVVVAVVVPQVRQVALEQMAVRHAE